jgi:hypothetical protein
MSSRVWTCTREPVFDALSLPLHPCVIFLIAFAALSFRAHQRYAIDELASSLWRALLKTALALCGFFWFWACLIRFAFQMDPALVLNAVPYVWSVAGWTVLWRVRRRWQLSSAAERQRRPPGFMAVRWVIPCFVALLLARPWVPNTNLLLSFPYKLFEWPLAWSTNFIASDECLASRVTEYGYGWLYGIAHIIGEPAYNELKFRGKAAVPGISAALYDSLDLEAISPGFYARRYTGFYSEDAVTDYEYRARDGISFLLTQVGKYGGPQPVLHAWKTRGPAPELRGEADHVLTCIRIGRQSLIDKATGPGCALPGEFCENDKCYKIFGEHCTLGSECYSNTCEGHTCCQPLGEACNGSECCTGAACSAGRCATRGTSSPASSGQ